MKLRKGHNWARENLDTDYQPDIKWQELYSRSIPIFEELEKLGVERTFSEALLVFGPLVTDSFVSQFKEAG